LPRLEDRGCWVGGQHKRQRSVPPRARSDMDPRRDLGGIPQATGSTTGALRVRCEPVLQAGPGIPQSPRFDSRISAVPGCETGWVFRRALCGHRQEDGTYVCTHAQTHAHTLHPSIPCHSLSFPFIPLAAAAAATQNQNQNQSSRKTAWRMNPSFFFWFVPLFLCSSPCGFGAFRPFSPRLVVSRSLLFSSKTMLRLPATADAWHETLAPRDRSRTCTIPTRARDSSNRAIRSSTSCAITDRPIPPLSTARPSGP